jgi:hypothetical protein
MNEKFEKSPACLKKKCARFEKVHACHAACKPGDFDCHHQCPKLFHMFHDHHHESRHGPHHGHHGEHKGDHHEHHRGHHWGHQHGGYPDDDEDDAEPADLHEEHQYSSYDKLGQKMQQFLKDEKAKKEPILV